MALALGANLGRPRHQLLAAIAELSRQLGTVAVAPLYRSAAVSAIPQPDYLNSALLVRTTLPAESLLAMAKELERRAGRRRGPRDGPRPLDIDLLTWGDRALVSRELTLPHPQLRERAFVLVPLAAIAPDLALPPDGRTAGELLAALPADPSLRRVPWNHDEA